MSLIFCVQKKGDDTNDEEAPFEATRKINATLKALVNKIPGIRIGSWLTSDSPKKSPLYRIR